MGMFPRFRCSRGNVCRVVLLTQPPQPGKIVGIFLRIALFASVVIKIMVLLYFPYFAASIICFWVM